MARPSDFDALLAEESTKRGGQPLRVDAVLAELDAETRASVETALRNPQVKANPLARAICRLGHQVGNNSITKWRERNL